MALVSCRDDVGGKLRREIRRAEAALVRRPRRHIEDEEIYTYFGEQVPDTGSTNRRFVSCVHYTKWSGYDWSKVRPMRLFAFRHFNLLHTNGDMY